MSWVWLYAPVTWLWLCFLQSTPPAAAQQLVSKSPPLALLTSEQVATAPQPLPFALADSTIRYYLARAVTEQGLAEASQLERRQTAAWLARAGARFVGRAAGYWVTSWDAAIERATLDSTQRMIAELRAALPAVVVQGAIFEIVYPGVQNLAIPNRVRASFGEDTTGAGRNFRFGEMMYPAYFQDEKSSYRWSNDPPGKAPGTPDMSSRETQMWFYYRACALIDAGCEALHFGQVQLMDDRDLGHHAWWALLQRVRAYARMRNRGFVLCDAHTPGEYYDPAPLHPVPDAERQLLFDFHSFPSRPTEGDQSADGVQTAHLTYSTSAQGACYGKSRGGLAPGGWVSQHSPLLLELDNFGPAAKPGQRGQWPWLWGLDEISWFAHQPQAYRNRWLVYAAGRVPQLDPDASFQMPGRRNVTGTAQNEQLYRADLAGQAETIQRIWAGQTAAEAQQLLLYGPPLPANGSTWPK